jgi:hypothetical protein
MDVTSSTSYLNGLLFSVSGQRLIKVALGNFGESESHSAGCSSDFAEMEGKSQVEKVASPRYV